MLWGSPTFARTLRDTTLPLGRCTLIVGPNGSGKSTAIGAFSALLSPGNFQFENLVTSGVEIDNDTFVSVRVEWDEPPGAIRVALQAISIVRSRPPCQ